MIREAGELSDEHKNPQSITVQMSHHKTINTQKKLTNPFSQIEQISALTHNLATQSLGKVE